MKIIAIAQDFGFGPISMLNRAIANLPTEIHVDYYIVKHLHAVIDERPNTKIVEIDNIDALKSLDLDSYNAAILACDYPAADMLSDKINKIIVYDMLFWFWPEIHKIVNKDILVIAQNFIGVEERAKSYNSSVKVVGPLLPQDFFTPYKQRVRDGILVNLGGFKSPRHDDFEADIYTRIISPLLLHYHNAGTKLCIAGGEIILDKIIRRHPVLAQYTQKLKHSEIRDRMYSADIFISISGLGSIYESFFTGTPTYFLPPTNYTQALQLERIIKHINQPFSFPHLNLKNGNCILSDDENNYIKNLFDLYALHAESIGHQILDDIVSFLRNSMKKNTDIILETSLFVEKMGGPGEIKGMNYVMDYLYA